MFVLLWAGTLDMASCLALVISHESSEAATRRDAVRQTWGSLRQQDFRLIFVLGGRRPASVRCRAHSTPSLTA